MSLMDVTDVLGVGVGLADSDLTGPLAAAAVVLGGLAVVGLRVVLLAVGVGLLEAGVGLVFPPGVLFRMDGVL